MDSKEQIHFLNPSLEEAFKYFYVVPEYQREYVWGDTEVEQLLSDIGEAFQTGKQKDYFIGSTVVCPNAESFELVDGQQRMTTFFILLCVLRKEYDMNGENNNVLRSMIFSEAMNDDGDTVAKYHLELQYADAGACLQKIATGEFPLEIGDATGSKARLINAANTIYRILQAQYPSFSEKKKFTAYMIKHVRFVQIKTQEMGDALKVFETINQRGIGLTPMDLMKNMIFRQVSRSKFPELNAIWKSIIDCLQNGKTQESPLRFLRYYLMATYDTSDCPNGILREDSIYSWLVSKNNKCENKTDPFGFVSRMKDGAERYMLYLSGGTNDPADNYIRNIPLIGGSAYKMHLLLLLAAKNMDAEAENHFKRILESIVYYSTVNKVRNNDVERAFVKWCPSLRAITSDEDLTAFINSAIIPEINAWKAENKTNFMLLGLNSLQQYRIRFILARISRYVECKRSGSGDPTEIRSLCGSSYEIEHVLPQKYKDNELPFGLDTDGYDRIKQRLGNLLLLEKSFNASIGNGSYKEKSQVYIKSGLYLTKSIIQKDCVGQDTAVNRLNEQLMSWDAWTPDAIEQRQEMLYQLSEEIWAIA